MQCTFLGNLTPVPTPAAGIGALYGLTQTLVAADNRVYPFWRRDGLTTSYPVVPVKAWATFIPTTSVGNATLVSNFNVTKVERTATVNLYKVTLAEMLFFTAGTVEYNVFLQPGANPTTGPAIAAWYPLGATFITIPAATANIFYITISDTAPRLSFMVVQ